MKERNNSILRLREIMQQQSITLADLATKANMHTANLSLLVNGKRNPTLDTMDRLAEALGIPTWHLIQDPTILESERQRANNLQQRCDQLSAQIAQLYDEKRNKPEPTTDLIIVDPHTGETRLYHRIIEH